MNFDWNELAFGSKKPIDKLDATFIAAPREMSAKRFVQLIKLLLPKGNIVVGLAKEPYVAGFEGQPQFRTLEAKTIKEILEKVNLSASKHKLYTLSYYQRDSKYVLEKLKFQRVIFINGSWRHSFHTTEAYYVLARRNIPYELVSPFCDGAEAKAYEQTADLVIGQRLLLPNFGDTQSELNLMKLTTQVAAQSYDYTHQVGVVLAKPAGNSKYAFITSTFNKVVPYQTFALHHGGLRDTHFSPPNDLNHYDTNHAEVGLLIKAAETNIALKQSTLFINVLPCPTCTRMLSRTSISEIVYAVDHSAGYALKMLEISGKKVRRLVP